MTFLIEKHVVKGLKEPDRCSTYSKGKFVNLPSLNSIKKAIKEGDLLVNGNTVNTGTWIKNGDVIELYDSDKTPPKQYQLSIEVVYEDDYFAVINKPAGISVSGNQFRTIQNALIGNINISKLPNALKWPRPVHRLDNQTSGLLIVSKTVDSHILLGKMFEERRIEKTYYAIVMGKPSSMGEFNNNIDGQIARTKFEVINTVNSLRSEYLSLVKLVPLTGRTHQLRIHLSQNGFPILGDKLYGKSGLILLKDGLYLCATGLKLNHPITGEEMDVSIPLPYKFSKRLDNENRRWEKYNL